MYLTEYFTNFGVHEVQKKIYDTELITLNIPFCNCWKFMTMYLVQYPPHQNTNTHTITYELYIVIIYVLCLPKYKMKN